MNFYRLTASYIKCNLGGPSKQWCFGIDFVTCHLGRKMQSGYPHMTAVRSTNQQIPCTKSKSVTSVKNARETFEVNLLAVRRLERSVL